MRRLVAALPLLDAGCVALPASVTRNIGAPEFATTDSDAVVVLDEVPPGAVVLGTVMGRGAGSLMLLVSDEVTSAKHAAAGLGADAIVIQRRGSEPFEQDEILHRTVPTVTALAIRLAK